MATVSIGDVTKIYDKNVVAVDNVSLDIEDGEFVTLVGPSGSGKSTLLRMLAGVVSVTDGTISFGDDDVTETPPQQRDIAMVFQNYALYPNMTVRGNMEFGLKMQGMPKQERNEGVEEAAEMLQIEELLDREIQALSGGQQQRVALGRSLVRDPKVFLLDEPLANLDAKLRVEMRATLVELQRELDVTTVYVTHNQIEAMTMSDRVAVVHQGCIQQLAEPQELFNNPANKFVADFIGTPSMNFLDCEVTQTNDAVTLNTDIHEITLQTGEERVSHIHERTTEGAKYILGIRPQHFIVRGNDSLESDNNRTVRMEVAVVETAGDEYILHLDKNGERVIVVVDEGMDVERGDFVNIEFLPERIHLFNNSDGQAVL
ncbi:ABC transporter ATP-binding protein [Haladaptatus sp. DFWS20]|uniref:ABC transporter ATP-binding protein n=1 Tax=Haladaptatus sp. DFWS20 TaxID=3403467 RepID=UPI003EC08E8B